MFAAILISKLLPFVVTHAKAGVLFLDRPGRREAAGGHNRGLIPVPSPVKKDRDQCGQ
jgi:hypothetical protein